MNLIEEPTVSAPRPMAPEPREGAGHDIEVLIQHRTGWIAIDWAEMSRCRELLYFFVWRDVKLRYKQTVLGVAWAVLQPLLTMLIFTAVFGRIANMQSQSAVPYPAFVFAGLILWTYFSSSVTLAGMSLVNNQHMLTKVYFPRLFIPMSCVGALLVDLAASLAIMVVLNLYYNITPSWQFPLALPLILLVTLASLGVGCFCAALTVLYRDFRYLVVFGVQILMYLSPVIFPPELLPRKYHPILALNPMFGLIDGFRSAIFGLPWNYGIVAISSVSTLFMLAFGLFYFRRTERRFADIV